MKYCGTNKAPHTCSYCGYDIPKNKGCLYLLEHGTWIAYHKKCISKSPNASKAMHSFDTKA